VDIGAVLALEGNVFDGSELDFGEQGVVLRRQFAKLAIFQREDLGSRCVAGG
jgi:hypothetical protein